MIIGSHVSNKGDRMLEGAVSEALSYQANALMVYLGAPQNSYRKPISKFRIDEARRLAADNNIDMANIIVHAPYIINLAQADGRKRRFAVDFLVSEIINASIIGVKYYVFHPGSYLKSTPEEGIKTVALSLTEIVKRTADTPVDLVVETMAGKGTELCRRFSEIKDLLNATASPRLKVCFDTCHVHDAGYDIVNDYDGVMARFDREIGFDRLALFHINDSKNERGSRKDRHQNIGYGKIGYKALHRLVSDNRFADRAKILETPYVEAGGNKYPPYKEEIAMLKQHKFIDFIGEMKKG